MNREIRYISQNELDRLKWDKCIAHSANRLIYGYSWYLDLVAQTWDALITDDYQFVFPLPYRNKGGIKYVYQPPFTQQLGLFSAQEITDHIIQQFIEKIPRDIKLIEYNLNECNPIDLTSTSFIKNSNVILDLAHPYAELYAKYSENLRRNLKKANSNNLKLTHEVEIPNVFTMFNENKGKELGVFKHGELSVLERIFVEGTNKGFVKAYGVTDINRKLVAAALLLYDRNRCIFLFSASTPTAKETAAMPWLIDQLIRELADKEMIFDFEGSNDRNLARFYLGFGSSERPYYRLRINKLNFIQQQILRIYKKIR